LSATEAAIEVVVAALIVAGVALEVEAAVVLEAEAVIVIVVVAVRERADGAGTTIMRARVTLIVMMQTVVQFNRKKID
jgi:hypothetical protein